jgi:hypothetical protein
MQTGEIRRDVSFPVDSGYFNWRLELNKDNQKQLCSPAHITRGMASCTHA